jgi:hypothetical protein
MSLVTTTVYQRAYYNLWRKRLCDLADAAAHVYVLLCTTYVPDFVNHDSLSDITNEVSGSGYTTGGLELTSKALVISGGNLLFSASDALWTPSTLSGVTSYVMYDRTPAANADRKLILCGQFASKSTSASDFLIDFSAISIFSQPF